MNLNQITLKPISIEHRFKFKLSSFLFGVYIFTYITFKKSDKENVKKLHDISKQKYFYQQNRDWVYDTGFHDDTLS